ncbi:hypothetical protein MRX96_000834 [Rhipicephalus microplus]
MTTILTYLPTKQDFERYLGERSLDNADAAGDQARMNQMSQAISSLMNVRLPDELENEINYSDPSVLDRELEEQALLRAKMVRSVSSIMNVDTLSSLEQVGSALTAYRRRRKWRRQRGKRSDHKAAEKDRVPRIQPESGSTPATSRLLHVRSRHHGWHRVGAYHAGRNYF